MPQKIYWIDNLRAVACLMVIVIHTTTWYITGPMAVTGTTWDLANLLNSASRVCVPLFFMISGYLFFGERSAQPRHMVRLVLCLLFYSAVSLAYITWLTPISEGRSILKMLQKPVFYHLWFFFALIGIYLMSPLIQVKMCRRVMWRYWCWCWRCSPTPIRSVSRWARFISCRLTSMSAVTAFTTCSMHCWDGRLAPWIRPGAA